MKERKLYLVRHGALEQDAERRFIGQLDLPLSQVGIAQAHALHAIVERGEVDRIYCSDLSRSRQTAEILAGGSRALISPRKDLREVSLGSWEGCTRATILAKYPLEFKARGEDLEHYTPPGGESFGDCRSRVIAALNEIWEQSKGDVLIAGHAGVNRLIVCEALGIPVSNIFRIRQDYGCLNVLEFGDCGYRVKVLNYTQRNILFDASQASPVSESVLVS